MSEKSMWGRIRKALTPMLDPCRVENRVEAGTPDVNLSSGAWIELKWIRALPKRGGVVVLEHWSPEQKVWHTRRHLAGGKTFVLLKTGNEWLLFNGYAATEFLGKVDIITLREKAIGKWKVRLNDAELRQLLTT